MRLVLRSISKTFNAGLPNEVRAVASADLTFNQGDNVLILGNNGSGKSTLLYLIDGHLSPTTGEIHLDDRRIDGLAPHHRAQWLFRLFQESALGVVALGTIEENMALAHTRGTRRSWFRRLLKNEERQFYSETIAQYRPELSKMVEKKVYALSPGERQGLVLALLKLQAGGRPGVLLADEPTASLDPAMATKCIDTIEAYASKGWICLSVTHDKEWISLHKGRRIVMECGKVHVDEIRTDRST